MPFFHRALRMKRLSSLLFSVLKLFSSSDIFLQLEHNEIHAHLASTEILMRLCKLPSVRQDLILFCAKNSRSHETLLIGKLRAILARVLANPVKLPLWFLIVTLQNLVIFKAFETVTDTSQWRRNPLKIHGHPNIEHHLQAHSSHFRYMICLTQIVIIDPPFKLRYQR